MEQAFPLVSTSGVRRQERLAYATSCGRSTPDRAAPLMGQHSTGSPFQKQLTILQNMMNNCDTLRDNFPQGFAETLS